MKINLENKKLNFNARFASDATTKKVLKKLVHASTPVSVYYAIHALNQAEPDDVISINEIEPIQKGNDKIKFINESIPLSNTSRESIEFNNLPSYFIKNLLNLKLSNGKTINSYVKNDSKIEYFYSNKQAKESFIEKAKTTELEKRIIELNDKIQELEQERTKLVKQTAKQEEECIDSLINLL